MPRRAPPPDFRYVWLMPGPSSAALAAAVGTVGLGAFGVTLWSTGHPPIALGIALAGGAVATLFAARNEMGAGVREIAMAIVPWGVLLSPDTEARVLRWPAIRRVSVHASHTLRGGTPTVVATLVQVETEREIFGGRTPGPVGLEGLTVNLESYAEEAARPVAADLEGVERCGDGATEPVMDDLLRCADELCTTARGAALLHLPPGGYRSVSNRGVAPETLFLLRATLAGTLTPSPLADPRPLAAIVAALLGARELLPELYRITVSPHPVVAAVARAAAIRLGAPRNRAGAIDEVAAFLFSEDHERIARWAEE
jgi:hypothetical protein